MKEKFGFLKFVFILYIILILLPSIYVIIAGGLLWEIKGVGSQESLVVFLINIPFAVYFISSFRKIIVIDKVLAGKNDFKKEIVIEENSEILFYIIIVMLAIISILTLVYAYSVITTLIKNYSDYEDLVKSRLKDFIFSLIPVFGIISMLFWYTLKSNKVIAEFVDEYGS